MFWVNIILYITLCVFSDQLCGRSRRKSNEQECFINGRYVKAFDMVLRDMLLQEEKKLTLEKASNWRDCVAAKFCQKDNLVRMYDY